jgi:hypothetical protein
MKGYAPAAATGLQTIDERLCPCRCYGLQNNR